MTADLIDQHNFWQAARTGDMQGLADFIRRYPQDLECKDTDGWTALMYATIHRRPDVVALLLSAGAYPDTQNQRRRTALHIAAGTDCKEIALMLLEGGASRAIKDDSGETPVESAGTVYPETARAVLLWRPQKKTPQRDEEKARTQEQLRRLRAYAVKPLFRKRRP